MKIIKINYLTWYFLFILFLCGYIKIGLIIFLIVIIHELGHVLASKLFHYKVLEVTLYPFGGVTKLEKDINTPVKKEIVIASAGIIMQIILMFVLKFLPQSDMKDIFEKYNLSIMIFNLLPIIPLDGSLILKAILNRFFSFQKSYFIYVTLSILSITIYIAFNFWFALNNYLIVFLFIFKLYKSIKDYKYIYNRFLLERYLKNYDYRFISTKKGSLNILKLETYQFFKEDGKIISESTKLQEKFDNSGYI